MADFTALKTALGDLDEVAVTSILTKLMGDGADTGEALAACQEGMSIVGTKFESGEYYVADLIYSGELMNIAANIIRPYMTGGGAAASGRVLLATVQGDLHDIGKNIVKSMLEVASFEVVDLGIDVSAETILNKAKETGIRIIALSGVLTLALEAMKATVDAFAAAGMRDQVKVIIGGAAVNEVSSKFVGADSWAYSPALGAKICSEWAESM